MTKRITVDAAKKVPCPRCFAKAGKPCTSTSGGVLRTVVHIARKRALVTS